MAMPASSMRASTGTSGISMPAKSSHMSSFFSSHLEVLGEAQGAIDVLTGEVQRVVDQRLVHSKLLGAGLADKVDDLTHLEVHTAGDEPFERHRAGARASAVGQGAITQQVGGKQRVEGEAGALDAAVFEVGDVELAVVRDLLDGGVAKQRRHLLQHLVCFELRRPAEGQLVPGRHIVGLADRGRRRDADEQRVVRAVAHQLEVVGEAPGLAQAGDHGVEVRLGGHELVRRLAQAEVR